jgi:hypothetical protein
MPYKDPIRRRECQRKASRRWYATNKEKARTKQRLLDARRVWTDERRFQVLKKNAKVRGLVVGISLEEFKELRSQPCHYCGGPLPEKGSGTDRINNALGYLSGNCQPCCAICNECKMERSEEEFLLHIQKISQHLGLSE